MDFGQESSCAVYELSVIWSWLQYGIDEIMEDEICRGTLNIWTLSKNWTLISKQINILDPGSILVLGSDRFMGTSIIFREGENVKEKIILDHFPVGNILAKWIEEFHEFYVNYIDYFDRMPMADTILLYMKKQ